MPDHPKNSGKISREDVISGPIGKEDFRYFWSPFWIPRKKTFDQRGKISASPFHGL